MTSEQGRKIFFNDRSLNPGEGYKILFGGGPRLTDIDTSSKSQGIVDDAWGFIHRLVLLLRKERVADGACPFWCSYSLLTSFSSVLPVLLDDINDRMLNWGAKGKINPFKEVYDVRSILFMHQPLS